MRTFFREFFRIGNDFQWKVAGFMSWQHLTFVTSLVVLMVILAVMLGKRNRLADDKKKNKVLIWSAILIDGFELVKSIISCAEDPGAWTMMLPLFLCSIQLIVIPLAAFTRGRVKEASLDFVSIFGLLGALLGTYGAAQNYGCYPVLSFPNVVSGITHCISGFAALYILISGMASMDKKDVPITLSILTFFCVAAYVANDLVDYNYMFLRRGDGTPYDIFYNLVNGHPVWYPAIVIGLFFVYILSFYAIFFAIKKRKAAKV